MRPGFTLLVINERSGVVREAHLPRGTLWATGTALLLSLVLAGGLGWILAGALTTTSARGSIRHIVSRGGTPLTFLAPEAQASTAPATTDCPEDMVLVDGKHCPEVHHRCKRFVDPEGSSLRALRCAEYDEPRCLSPQRKQLRYCIDRHEFVRPGQQLPLSGQTFADARRLCASAGKRLCTEEEWTFACEGELMLPYPYGFARDASACNVDQNDLVNGKGALLDRRQAPGSFRKCKSPFGVLDLSGNVEEYVARNGSAVVKGAYWQPGANHCRATRLEADPSYRGVELGFRCCSGTT